MLHFCQVVTNLMGYCHIPVQGFGRSFLLQQRGPVIRLSFLTNSPSLFSRVNKVCSIALKTYLWLYQKKILVLGLTKKKCTNFGEIVKNRIFPVIWGFISKNCRPKHNFLLCFPRCRYFSNTFPASAASHMEEWRSLHPC